MKSARCLAAAIALLALPALAGAELKLPAMFSDNMVLQMDSPVPVWGWAQAKDTVTVEFAGQTKSAKADEKGKWSLKLSPLKANAEPKTLVVSSSAGKKLEIGNVLVGQVWLCSGQSNMAWPVSRAKNFKAEQAAAKYPQIRMLTVARRGAPAPTDNCGGHWAVCSPETVAGFSATAYFFGRKLHKELNVPVGLINSSVGGTAIELWTPKAKATPPAPKRPLSRRELRARRGRGGSGGLYNGMIAPLAPYAIRGAIWYQGEANASRGGPYGKQLTTMIGAWRELWGQGDFPFLWVQLPNFRKPQTAPCEPDGWVSVQEGMFKALAIPNTGMAVTIDIGEAGNIHPGNKQDVGKRLALWALGTTYGKSGVYSGPLYTSMKIGGDKIVLSFDHVGGGLQVRDNGELKGFAIAGANKKFVWARAKIVGDTIEVTGVTAPKAVRYAWAPNPKCNLVNKEGLPASPFRTDDWK